MCYCNININDISRKITCNMNINYVLLYLCCVSCLVASSVRVCAHAINLCSMYLLLQPNELSSSKLKCIGCQLKWGRKCTHGNYFQ